MVALAVHDARHPWCAGSADLCLDAAGAPEGREATLTNEAPLRPVLTANVRHFLAAASFNVEPFVP